MTCRRLIFLALCSSLGACGGSSTQPPPSDGGVPTTEPAAWGFFDYRSDFVDGLVNARWGRATEILWPAVETPPGSGTYDWSYLDTSIGRAQTSGVSVILVLKTSNGAAYSEPTCFQAIEADVTAGTIPIIERRHYSCPIKAEMEDAWSRWVSELVERYDRDGDRDMPGSTGAIRVDIEIENEAADPQYWGYGEADATAAADSYLRLLELSYQAKQAADPDTQVILTGLIFPHLLARCDGNSGCGYTGPIFQRNMTFTKRILARPEFFDAVDVHFFSYYHFDPAYIDDGFRWVVDQMAQHGYQRPIYTLEWTGSIMLNISLFGYGAEFIAYFPYSADFASPAEASAMYLGLDQPENVVYRRWFEAEQAKEFGKLFTNMLALGVTRLVHVRYNDYYDGGNWDNVWWNWQGAIKYVGGVAIRKPSYYTYNIFSERLFGFTGARRIEQGNGVRLYEFTFATRDPVYVLWSDAGDKTLDLSSVVGSPSFRVTHVVTELDGTNQPVVVPADTVPASTVPAGDVPVLLEGVE